MHRHGFKGRKFGRETDQRRALIKGLASNLAMQESIETTIPKAKDLVPYFEKLITKSKAGGLHNRRQVIAKMANEESANKLFDEIAPKLTARSSGYLRIARTTVRLGDNTEMAKVSFVDDLKVKSEPVVEKKAPVTAKTKKPVAVKKPVKQAKAKETK
jgi:large subunit ribosomal protein L17